MTSPSPQPDKAAPVPQHPLFSVVVPIYNHAPYIGATLDSLLAQTCPDWEALLVNDGSTDSTPDVLAEYAQKDKRFRVFHKENGGTSTALNLGLQHAQGDWICWLSSDDLFDPRKLEIHWDWIIRNPGERFFFTYFREFNDLSSEISDPPLWYPAPEREWQVVEMLHHTYVHGNSICVNRELWTQAGYFDTKLRYGQDYDMWLRLAALSPATFIPERTCLSRNNPLQQIHAFPEGALLDCAKAGINFLNERTFAQLFPAVDLTDATRARQAVVKALDVAENPYSFIYRLGAHPLLILRILQWAWDERQPEETATSIRRVIRQRAVEASRQYPQTTLGFLWKVADIASQLLRADNSDKLIAEQTLSPATIAEAEYWRRAAAEDPGAKTLRHYLERFEGKTLPGSSGHQARGEVLFLYHADGNGFAAADSAVLTRLIEGAKRLMRSGRNVALIIVGGAGIGIIDGVLAVGAPNTDLLARALKSTGPLDTIIEAPRRELLGALAARRALVYRPGSKPGESAILGTAGASGAVADVGIMLSDSADWSDVIERFEPARDSDKQMSTEFLRRVDQVKRKVRRIARL